MRRARTGPALLAATALAAGVVLLSLFLGAAPLDADRVLPALFGAGSDLEVAIVRDARLARALLAALCGAALAGAGGVFQGLFRNPLADPFVMGVSGGAALGAATVVALGWIEQAAMTLAAFAGGIGAAFAAYRLGRVHGRTPVTSLVLAGFAVGLFCSALLSIVLLVSTHNWNEILRFLFGSCSQPETWRSLAVATPLVALALGVAWLHRRELDLLSLGEEPAQHLGVDVERAKAWLVAAGAVLTATAVAVCGIVGFVGLIVPHTARAVVGPGHGRLLPVAVMGGAATLAGADLVARSVLEPHELPLGAVTAILGAPVFLALWRRRLGA